MRLQAIDILARRFHDRSLVPRLQAMIARSERRPDAFRALRYLTDDPQVVRYLHESLKDAHTVIYAKQALNDARLAFDPKEAVIARQSYSNWQLGIDLEFPEDWPLADDRGDYYAIFRKRELDAFFAYTMEPEGGSPDAAKHRVQLERANKLPNELSPAETSPPPERWAATHATSVSQGRYQLTRDGHDIIRRLVVLARPERQVVLLGEAPAEHAPEFDAVFDRVWPSVTFTSPDPALVERLNGALKRLK